MSEEELEKRKHRIIKRDVPAIKGILETIVDPDDLNGLAHQLTEVIAIGGNIATILPESQAILGHAKYNAMKMAKASNEKISPTELKMVVEGCSSNASGEAVITFEPPIRNSPADNASITITKPKTVMMLSDDEQINWTNAESILLSGLTFSFSEVSS